MNIEAKVAELLAREIMEKAGLLSSDKPTSESEPEAKVEKCQEPTRYDGEYCIVILQRGWVFVGQLHQRGSHCELVNAACIRKWGTTKGLGQIALDGPTSETILDKCPPMHFHELTAVGIMECAEEKWTNVI